MTKRAQSNAILSRWARDSLKEYIRVSGGDVEEKNAVPLLIASLLHLGNQFTFQLNSTQVIQKAVELYEWECKDN